MSIQTEVVGLRLVKTKIERLACGSAIRISPIFVRCLLVVVGGGGRGWSNFLYFNRQMSKHETSSKVTIVSFFKNILVI